MQGQHLPFYSSGSKAELRLSYSLVLLISVFTCTNSSVGNKPLPNKPREKRQTKAIKNVAMRRLQICYFCQNASVFKRQNK